MLSTGQIAIQWISVNKTNHSIRWIVIYPVDSVIHLSNSPGQGYDTYIADPISLKHGKQDSFPQILRASRHLSIDQFRYIKIQPTAIDLRTRLWGINPTNSVVIPQSLVLGSIVLG